MTTLRWADVADAATVHRLTLAAFAPHAALDPPSGALSETVEHVRTQLSEHRGLLALVDDLPAGCLRVEVRDGAPHVRRVAVDPAYQGRGICRAMMEHVERWAAASGFDRIVLGARSQLTSNIALYEHLGYAVVAEHLHPDTGRAFWVELHRPLGRTLGAGGRHGG